MRDFLNVALVILTRAELFRSMRALGVKSVNVSVRSLPRSSDPPLSLLGTVSPEEDGEISMKRQNLNQSEKQRDLS